MHPEAQRLIGLLDLEPHPEGGWYRETWRGRGEAQVRGLDGEVAGRRSPGTSIYYMLADQEVSHLHRLQVDEVWHLYAGGPLLLQVLHPGGDLRTIELGDQETASYQTIVPAGHWFGAMLADAGSYALAGCTLAPGYHSDDCELADGQALARTFPVHAELIRRLTPDRSG